MRVLGLACVYVVVALRLAHGEPRKTLAPVSLRAKPGERAAVVARLAANTVVHVVATEGRWLRVRVNSVEGYLTRTTVSSPPATTVPAAQWSAARRADGNLTPTTIVAGADLREVAHDDPPPPPAAGVRVELGLGFRTLGMSLTSNAQGGLANYVLDADAVAETLAVDAVRRGSRALFVGADLRGAASESSPGIDYPGPTAPAGKIAFRTLAADAGIRVGTRARRVFDLAARVGGHYDAFLARNVRNAGMLPREGLLGATLGARIDIAPAQSRFTVSARFDVLVLGSRKQTEGLEDGTASTARALWGGLTVRYAVARQISIFGGYDFARASTTWRGASVRQPGVTATQRIDTAQLVEIGLSAAL